MDLIQDLNWRYAVKRMTGAAVPPEKMNTILEAIRLSASSMGLQPYTIFNISNPALKQEIFDKAAKQPQVLEASALLVFAAWHPISEGQVSDYINQVASERNVDPETLSGFKTNILNLINNRTEDVNFNWAARQCYIALGSGLVAAAVEKVDATPMEGFNPAALDEVLGLKEIGLRSVVIMTLGYRDAEKDPLINAKKVRRAKDKLFVNLD